MNGYGIGYSTWLFQLLRESGNIAFRMVRSIPYGPMSWYINHGLMSCPFGSEGPDQLHVIVGHVANSSSSQSATS